MSASTEYKNRIRKDALAPNPQLWAELENGEKLTAILNEFYSLAFADPRLGPFFRDVTKQRVIEKQYNFLYEILTGEPVYFGERPRNAHHYMVISHELFEYREQLLADVARRHGLSERGVLSLRTVNEVFRKQIVKDKPFPKKLGGVAFPLEGYETLTLSVGSVCDDCFCELAEGQRATYHVRTGKTYCDACASKYTATTAVDSSIHPATEDDADCTDS
ncbi:MAG: group 1 truncated hemoglobin [Myxococcales bacterium]|nr:group 1 truncated hemoglobin [Myxococcales bacterium]